MCNKWNKYIIHQKKKNIYIYIYVYILIWKPFNDVLDKNKIVLNTHLLNKVFRFLYRSFVSIYLFICIYI